MQRLKIEEGSFFWCNFAYQDMHVIMVGKFIKHELHWK